MARVRGSGRVCGGDGFAVVVDGGGVMDEWTRGREGEGEGFGLGLGWGWFEMEMEIEAQVNRNTTCPAWRTTLILLTFL